MGFRHFVVQLPSHAAISRYGLAPILVFFATLLTLKTQPVLGEISPIYFAAVVVSTWFGGLGPGLLATALAGWASAYFFHDIPIGTGIFGWDDTLRLAVFLMVALLMSSLIHLRASAEEALRRTNDSLEQRVSERTAELKLSNQLVLDISEQEQRRIGHDLHDVLGQQLTGIAFLSRNLSRRLGEQSLAGATEADRISVLINTAIDQTRELARGLSPVELGDDGLVAALHNLCKQINETSEVDCQLECDGDTRIGSHTASMHLYRIAQEALNNAVRHSGAKQIRIALEQTAGDIILRVADDGIGFAPENIEGNGMGLHLMPYRARMIGAPLSIEPGSAGGTVVRCVYSQASQK